MALRGFLPLLRLGFRERVNGHLPSSVIQGSERYFSRSSLIADLAGKEWRNLYGLAPARHDRSLEENYQAALVSKWHTQKVLPEGWSCDWADWSFTREFGEYGGYRPSEAEQQFHIVHQIQGAVTPLAWYGYCDCEARCAIFADGKYYLYYTGRGDLFRFDFPAESFASHEDFLQWHWKSETYLTGEPKTGVTHIGPGWVNPLDQVDVYGGYSQSSPDLLDSFVRVVNPPRRYMGRASARELSKDWYRFEGPTPAKWACDWENWHGITEFFVQPTWFNLSPIDITLRVQFNVNGTVEPLAFCQGPEDDIFHYQDYNLLFATGSEYYDLDRSVYRAEGSVLYRYEERFASHADFLARVDGASRVRIPPMPEYEDRIDTIEHEQMTLRTTDWLLKIERQN